MRISQQRINWLKEELKRLALFLLMAFGVAVMLSGVFLFLQILAYHFGPNGGRDRSTLLGYIASLAIIALGYGIVVCPAWLEKRSGGT